MKIKLGITDSGRKKIAGELQHLLADTYATYLKTQNFHWNLKGPNFYSLHLLFEKQYEEMSGAVDEIAERIQTLGFHVDGSFAGFSKNCCVKDSRKAMPAKKMLQTLIADHEALIRCAREIAGMAEDEKDQATVDLMARRLGVHEKFVWMLRSQLA
ncbi:MAG: DNA starvation/stationary phase protection protein [Verrucomicrobia bacterium]|nr:DNA starvation/stationary phase protection protein [Verrucomicrobiota bacterium]